MDLATNPAPLGLHFPISIGKKSNLKNKKLCFFIDVRERKREGERLRKFDDSGILDPFDKGAN